RRAGAAGARRRADRAARCHHPQRPDPRARDRRRHRPRRGPPQPLDGGRALAHRRLAGVADLPDGSIASGRGAAAGRAAMRGDCIDCNAIICYAGRRASPMASITIRQLEDALKKRLRLRAARNGRSMEDEVRTILRTAAGDDAERRPPAARTRAKAPARDPGPDAAPGGRRVLLIIGGGIAAYKSLDLIRRLKERDVSVRCILTAAAREFITPLSAGALSGERVFTDLFDPDSEFDVGHIRLAREADLVVVAPATADLMAKMAAGQAGDLATAVLLATDRKVLIAPAMNPQMWRHAATQRNLQRLADDGVAVVGPNAGEMAEAGEAGVGRMAEPLEIVAAALPFLPADAQAQALAGKRGIVTSRPTRQPIDPVRYIA